MKVSITCPNCETGFTLFESRALAQNKCIKLSMACRCPICAGTFAVSVKIDKGLTSVNFSEASKEDEADE